MDAQAAIDQVLEQALADGVVPCAALSVAGRDTVAYVRVEGQLSRNHDLPALTDTLFYIASMTKAVTAVAFLQLVEQGLVSLDQRVADILPDHDVPLVLDGYEANGRPMLRPARSLPTLEQAFTHTAGYSGGTWNPDIKRYQAEFGIPGAVSGQRKAFELPLAFDPGTRWEYGMGMDVIGQVIEAVSGQSLEAYMVEHIFDPLGMPDTRYSLSLEQFDHMARMFARQDDGSLVEQPFKAMTFPDFFPGGGGLASTIVDFSRFVRLLLGDGSLDGARILEPDTMAMLGADAIGGLGVPPVRSFDPAVSYDIDLLHGATGDWGLSFLVNRAPLPTGRQPGALCWAGLRNTFFWADRAAGVGGVMLCQTAPFMDPRVTNFFSQFEAGAYALCAERAGNEADA